MDNENNIETDIEDSAEETDIAPETSHSNLPLVILLIALLIYFGFQTFALLGERGNLGQVKFSQENALQEAQKIQSQFRTLVTKTGELADKGHTGAKLVMEGLQRQGMGMAGPSAKAAETTAEKAPEKVPEKAPEKAEAKPAK